MIDGPRASSAVLTAIASTLLLTFPTAAAEHIHFRYDDFNLAISVEALKTYAQSGQTDPDLEAYLALLPSKTQTNFRRFLTTPFQAETQQLAPVLNAPMGQMMLQEVGQVIQTPSGDNGSSHLKSALMMAEQDTVGLTPLNIVQHLKTDIQVDLKRVFQLLEQLAALKQKKNRFIQHLPPAIATMPTPQSLDLSQRGKRSIAKERIAIAYHTQNLITGQPRQRRVSADLYLPDRAAAPVIVMSHGLGGSRKGHAYFAQHLASHGFAVVAMQHPGSDQAQSQALHDGRSPYLVDVNTFVDRPLDITQMLNALERRDQGGRLNLKQVGVFGYSLGGYTALALAGAKIDFAQLAHDCKTQSFLLNPSLLLQCRALELPHRDYRLQDHRVKALIVINPVNASILASGLEQIEVPILWGIGSKDIVAPMALEHLDSFQSLTTAHKYLGVVNGAHHGSSPVGAVPSPEASNATVLEDYLKAIGLAFLQVHVRDNAMYRTYLRPSYAESISREPYPLSVMTADDTSALYKH